MVNNKFIVCQFFIVLLFIGFDSCVSRKNEGDG